ncbi:MAG: TIGR01777 family oxidoreductase [Burkholderiaceae bacterium]
MNTVFLILAVQAVLGGFDNFWHHELHAKLPRRASARHELALHAAREAIYGVVFLGLAWFEWRGVLALLLAALLAAEVVITLADFLEEDRSRKLPPFERVLHTVLAVTYGLFLGTLAPHLLEWFAQPSGFAWTPHGRVSWAFSVCAAGLFAWSARNATAVRRLGRLASPSASQGCGGRRECSVTRTDHLIIPAVLVTGATGFIGRTLVTQLRAEGVRVIALARDVTQARATFGPDVWVVDRLDAIPAETRIDAVVNLAGARVLGMPWTSARRATLLASRVDVTAALVALMRRLEQRPRVLVSASAVGFYGASPAGSFEPLDEQSAPRPGQFQSDLCVAIEHEARRAEALGVRVVRLRFGVVLGRGDGAYPMLALSSRFGLGAVLGSGRQPAPWIHLDDAVALIRFSLGEPGLSGPVNAVAPDTRPQADFARAMAASFGRRVWLRMPGAPLRWALGEMADLLLEGQNVLPKEALAAGFQFRHPTLADAFACLAAPDAAIA